MRDSPAENTDKLAKKVKAMGIFCHNHLHCTCRQNSVCISFQKKIPKQKNVESSKLRKKRTSQLTTVNSKVAKRLTETDAPAVATAKKLIEGFEGRTTRSTTLSTNKKNCEWEDPAELHHRCFGVDRRVSSRVSDRLSKTTMSDLLRLTVFLLTTLTALKATPPHVQSSRLKYRHFDEYLLHLGRDFDAVIVEEREVIKMIATTETEALFEKRLPIRTGIRHNKDEKCCMLGSLAGEKGFHCVSRFYANRIQHRNYNRAHNKKVASVRKGKPYADKLMRTFEQCVVSHRGYVFHKCCRHAAMQ